jgi:hypothetical protein
MRASERTTSLTTPFLPYASEKTLTSPVEHTASNQVRLKVLMLEARGGGGRLTSESEERLVFDVDQGRIDGSCNQKGDLLRGLVHRPERGGLGDGRGSGDVREAVGRCIYLKKSRMSSDAICGGIEIQHEKLRPTWSDPGQIRVAERRRRRSQRLLVDDALGDRM